MAVVNAMVDIFIVSMILVVLTKFLQSRFIDKEKQKQQKQAMKEKQKRMRELAMKRDEKSRAELQKLQREMLEISSEMMRGSLRYMVISLPLVIVVFGFLRFAYGAEPIYLPFPLPWFSSFQFGNPATWIDLTLKNPLGWFSWYFYSYLILSIVIAIGARIKKLATARVE